MGCLKLQQELVGLLGQEGLLLEISPSTAWCDLKHVKSIVQRRNQFVCMQLWTMVKEQAAKVTAATAAGDTAALHAADFMFLATLTSKESNSVLAAGLFYPRSCSKDGSDMPHMYVELLCCNSPNRGLGSLLLQHIEQFVADNCDTISEVFFGITEPAAGSTDPLQDPAAAGLAGCGSIPSTAAPGDSSAGSAWDPTAVQLGPAVPQRRSYSSLPVLLPDGPIPPAVAAVFCGPQAALKSTGMCLSSSCSSVSSLASTVSTNSSASVGSSSGYSTSSVLSGSTSTGSCASLSSLQMPLSEPGGTPGLSGLSCGCGNAAAAAGSSLGASAPADDSAGTQGAGVGSMDASSNLCKACKIIQGIKLLSVQSAQGFYTKCGYGVPDSSCEMFKPLLALRHISTALPPGAVF